MWVYEYLTRVKEEVCFVCLLNELTLQCCRRGRIWGGFWHTLAQARRTQLLTSLTERPQRTRGLWDHPCCRAPTVWQPLLIHRTTFYLTNLRCWRLIGRQLGAHCRNITSCCRQEKSTELYLLTQELNYCPFQYFCPLPRLIGKIVSLYWPRVEISGHCWMAVVKVCAFVVRRIIRMFGEMEKGAV